MDNIPTIKVEIPRYFVATVNDYHGFHSIKWNLKTATKLNYKYQELDCLGYHAIFWTGKKPTEFIKNYEKQSKIDSAYNLGYIIQNEN
jgi:hypothetical protein